MKRFSLKYKLLVLTVIAMGVWTLAADMPFTFRAGEVISAEQMNQNFAALNTVKQERIEGECAEGSAIRVIGAEGKVTCETDDVGANGVGYTAGTGLDLTGTEFSIDVAETQARVKATCAAGSSIRTIGEDGKVTCEVDDVGSGGGSAGVDALNGMTGAITLQAGDNITIDDSTAGQLTINATAGGGGTTYIAGDGLTLENNQFSVKFDGSGTATTVARSDHEHFGQSWTGTGEFGLTVVNENQTAGADAIVGRLGTGSGLPAAEDGSAVWGDAQGQGRIGVYGTSDGYAGVYGNSSSSRGVLGESTDGIGVTGNSTNGTGVSGVSSSASDYGVFGYNQNGTGVKGLSSSSTGVFGETATGIGVWGRSQARGVVGTLGNTSCAGTYAVGGCGVNGIGVYGNSQTQGVVGTLGGSSCAGLYAVGGCNSTGIGTGVYGSSSSTSHYGVHGVNSSSGGFGVYGEASGGTGVFGRSSSSIGVFGVSAGTNAAGVYGENPNFIGVRGVSANGAAVRGDSTNGYSAEFIGGNAGDGYCYFAGGAGWSCTSDRNAKENFQPVDIALVLEAVAQLPITTWNMKGDANRTPHMGPVAQDFYAAFELGDSDTTINTADAQGVALAAIQGLYQLVQEQQEKIAELEARLAELE